jgi:hypothetical protein
MGTLLLIAGVAMLGWIAFSTIRSFRRKQVSPGWWVFLGLTLLAGIGTGVWAGFMFEYQASPTLRFAGFPLPVVIFQLESGVWVDYVHDTFISYLICVGDVVLVALCSMLPVSAVFYVYSFLHKR